jgi:hypothetical protein
MLSLNCHRQRARCQLARDGNPRFGGHPDGLAALSAGCDACTEQQVAALAEDPYLATHLVVVARPRTLMDVPYRQDRTLKLKGFDTLKAPNTISG